MVYVPPSGQSPSDSNGAAEIERVQRRMAAQDRARNEYLAREWWRSEPQQHPRSPINTGDRFGDWEVIREAEPHRVSGRVVRAVLVRCQCGREKEVLYQTLRSGRSHGCAFCAVARRHQ